MMTLGALSFLSPWILAALAALPVLWWLLRLTPPAPWRMRFPPIQLLLALVNKDETSAKSPWWLLLMRIALICALILAIAHPVLNASNEIDGSGPVVVFVDDGWASARNWAEHRALLDNLLDRADRAGRPILIVSTAPVAKIESTDDAGVAAPVSLKSATEARDLVQAMQPKPWPTNRLQALKGLEDSGVLNGQASGQVFWLSDGLDDGSVNETAARLRVFGSLAVVRDAADRPAYVLRPPGSEGSALMAEVMRADSGDAGAAWVRAVAENGRMLARREARFGAGIVKAEVRFDLPSEQRNSLVRLEIESNDTAAGVVLIDERWRRRPVGMVSGDSRIVAAPLLGNLYFLDKALNPFTEIRVGRPSDLLKRELAVMILADPGKIEPAEREALSEWVAKGGVLVRFAGPRLSQDSAALLPVKLRDGDRVMGGSMSWDKPATLAPFEDSSPFRGLKVPLDVTINRQVLAQPALDLAEKTWARLSDGTPLVTAEKRDKGWLIFVHTTANAAWSNLPLSGTFVAMLQRIIGLSQGVAGGAAARAPLPPIEVLDGFGHLRAPPASVLAIPGDEIDAIKAGPRQPPGYYGNQAARRALNLSRGLPDPLPILALPAGVAELSYGTDREVDFKPWLLLFALLVLAADLFASMLLRRMLQFGRAPAAAAMLLAFGLSGAASAQSAPPDEFAKDASLNTRLAYVITGNALVDQVSHAGLKGLSAVINRRTAAELSEPIGISPETDRLSFFPLLYWPMTAEQVSLTPDAVARINDFMRNGGTILFDTRAQGDPSLGSVLPRLGANIDIPRLIPMPSDHVLTRSYYLLKELPGRYTGGQIWVERTGSRVNDGVSSVIVGANDWAGAWAVDDGMQPLYPLATGGARQRELAYRVGVNLIMYTLTGNYKADQIHIPEILKRLDR